MHSPFGALAGETSLTKFLAPRLCDIPPDLLDRGVGLQGVNRISLPDADAARNVTGYERGTITPFGSATVLPVVADERIVGQTISIGAGGPGVAATLSGDDVIAHFAAQVADVTDPV